MAPTDPLWTRKGYVLVEGHGEVEAMQNLVVRLTSALDHSVVWRPPLRWKNLHQYEGARTSGIRSGVEFVRRRPDAGALLIVRDEDDGCPRELAPEVTRRLANEFAPFPIAFVLLRPEYEVLFLPCMHRMSAIGFPESASWDHETWESKRDVKGWLSSLLPAGRIYKPTVMQLPMTRRIEFGALRAADVPCFGTLERAIGALAENWGRARVVYPDPRGPPT